MSFQTKIAALTVTCLSLGITTIVYAGGEEAPQDPPWLMQDGDGNNGVVDATRLPATIGVLDCNGDVVGYARSSDVFALPSLTPDQFAAGAARDDVTVYDPVTEQPVGVVGDTCVTPNR